MAVESRDFCLLVIVTFSFIKKILLCFADSGDTRVVLGPAKESTGVARFLCCARHDLATPSELCGKI